MAVPLQDVEKQRLDALRRYQILDTIPEEAFDEITRLAVTVCGTPIGLITFIDGDRHWLAVADVQAFGVPDHKYGEEL
ncbi:MAG: hypothetical protein ACLQVD_17675, partial [Capsulimonadaceae bacterium]